MLKKSLFLWALLIINTITFAQQRTLVSIVPNQATKLQTITTTITGSNFFFMGATAPNTGNVKLQKSGSIINPVAVTVIDNDHFNATWTIPQAATVGLYSLTYFNFSPDWSGVLTNCFTVFDTCTIVATPASGTVCTGDSVRLSLSGATTYQWRFNGSDITGATQSFYYAKASGTYSVVTTGGTCNGTIPSFNVTVNSLPVVAITPSTIQYICAGQPVNLTATQGYNSYVWKKSGVTLPGSTSNSYYTATDSGNYTVTVTSLSTGCSNVSPATQVALVPLPVITVIKQPGSEGKDAVVASNAPTLNLGNSSELNALAWTVGGSPALMRSVFQFDLTGIPAGSALISATLNLYYDSLSSNANHAHTGSGNNPLIERLSAPWDEQTVTWNNKPASVLNSGVLLPASTSPTQDYLDMNILTLVKFMVDTPTGNYGFGMKLQNETYYRSVVFCSSDNYNPARRPKLVVKYLGVTVTSSKGSKICSGDSTKLQADTGPYTYQWKKNGVNINGATASFYYAKVSGSYKVIITNSLGCSLTSKVKSITVKPAAVAVITPGGPTSFCTGDSVSLNANTGAGLTYIWKKGTANIPGATGQSYIAKVKGSYKVKVTTADGCTKISPVVSVTTPCREENTLYGEDFKAEVFPNPSSGEFQIRVNDGNFENMVVRVYDVMGHLVKEIKTEQNNQVSFYLDSPGIYKAVVIRKNQTDVLSLVRVD